MRLKYPFFELSEVNKVYPFDCIIYHTKLIYSKYILKYEKLPTFSLYNTLYNLLRNILKINFIKLKYLTIIRQNVGH